MTDNFSGIKPSKNYFQSIIENQAASKPPQISNEYYYHKYYFLTALFSTMEFNEGILNKDLNLISIQELQELSHSEADIVDEELVLNDPSMNLGMKGIKNRAFFTEELDKLREEGIEPVLTSPIAKSSKSSGNSLS